MIAVYLCGLLIVIIFGGLVFAILDVALDAYENYHRKG